MVYIKGGYLPMVIAGNIGKLILTSNIDMNMNLRYPRYGLNENMER